MEGKDSKQNSTQSVQPPRPDSEAQREYLLELESQMKQCLVSSQLCMEDSKNYFSLIQSSNLQIRALENQIRQHIILDGFKKSDHPGRIDTAHQFQSRNFVPIVICHNY